MAANKVTAVHATAGCAMRFGRTLGPPRRAKAAHFFSEQFGADEQHPTSRGEPASPFSATIDEKVSLPRKAGVAIVRRAQDLRSFPGENGAPRMLEQIQQFLLHYFTWWNGANFNTRFYTRRFGELVGHDEFGNAYYRRPGIDPALGFERRWVIYNGVAEASMTPPGWNGWLHHTVDVPPSARQARFLLS